MLGKPNVEAKEVSFDRKLRFQGNLKLLPFFFFFILQSRFLCAREESERSEVNEADFLLGLFKSYISIVIVSRLVFFFFFVFSIAIIQMSTSFWKRSLRRWLHPLSSRFVSLCFVIQQLFGFFFQFFFLCSYFQLRHLSRQTLLFFITFIVIILILGDGGSGSV